MVSVRSLDRFTKFTWGVLAYNVLVILWGALVRATGSGAGCGSHWPLCNGEVIPTAPQVATMIEFAHRLSSGLALVGVLLLFIWAFRRYPKGHIVRLGAAISLFFILTEALVGAALVLFEWVAGDTSTARVIVMGLHLINTFMLLASLTLTAWWASGGKRLRFEGRTAMLLALGLGYLGVLVIGVTGAVTALGDTLFPVNSLAEGLRQDFNPASHFLVRLRVWHPLIAIAVGFYLIFVSGLLGMFRQERVIKRSTVALIVLFLVQLGAGLINLVLRAPVAMQIIHLFLADSVWIVLVLLGATTFADPNAVEPVREGRARSASGRAQSPQPLP